MIIIRADRANAKAVSTQLLTSGMVGAQVKFVFSHEWDDLLKTAVFQVGDTTIDVLDSQWDGNICTIPNECLAVPGKIITVGVYGCNDAGDLVIPTVYAKVGRVRVGADPTGDDTAKSSLPVYEQIRSSIGKLSDLETVDNSSIVAAINEALRSGGSGSGTIANAVMYTEQTLTGAQKQQARTNIGAGTSSFSGSYNDLADKPTTLPNPNTLTFTGAATGTYDGSEAITVDIPEADLSIAKIESLDKDNAKVLRGLADGNYILDGYFTPYTGSDSTFVFDPPALTSISSTESTTHVQIFEPYDNQIQHLVITDTSCEKTEVLLNGIAKSVAGIGDLAKLTTTAKDTLVDAINEAASCSIFTFTINRTVNTSDGGFTYSADKTFAEILEASQTREVIAKDYAGNYYDLAYAPETTDTSILFQLRVTDMVTNQYAKKVHYTINSDNTIVCDEFTINSLPAVTTSDNGKVLQVVNGAWTAVTSSGGTGESTNVIEF